MYRLHIANKNYSSWSLRPWALMRELGIPFEEVLRPFEGRDNFARFRDFSPTGMVPCLHDGDRRVWDSLAIAEYLAEAVSAVWPGSVAARAFARCAAAEMHSGFVDLRRLCPQNIAITVELKAVPEALRKDLDRIEELWQEGLARFGGPFLAGDSFTAADAFFCPVAFRCASYQLPLSPAAGVYRDRLLELPSMQAWRNAAIKEEARESSHEAEAAAVGRIVQDLRPAPKA